MLQRILLNDGADGGGGITNDGSTTGQHTEDVGQLTNVDQLSPDEIAPQNTGDFNEFLIAKGADAPTPAVVKTDDVKKVDDTTKASDEVKTGDEVKTDPKKDTTTIKTSPTIAQKAAARRDFSGLPKEAIPFFERMSNEAYDHLRPFYVDALKTKAELDEVKDKLSKVQSNPNAIPESYYENPNAFVLTPEYSTAAVNLDKAATVLEHWRSQLDAVRSGAKEYQMLTIDPATKQFALGEKRPVDVGTQSQIEQIFYGANEQYSRANQSLGMIQQNFMTKHTEAITKLRAYESATFAAFNDPKHPLQPQIQDVMKRIDPAFRNNPMLPLFAKALVALTAVANKYAELQKAPVKTVQQTKAELQRKAGPTAGDAGDASGNKNDEVTIEDFERVKEL